MTVHDAERHDLYRMFDCVGRVAVVTGAAGTLGPVWVRTLLGAGATVAMIVEPGRATTPELTELRNHPRVVTVDADVTVREDLERARHQITAVHGEVDILVANAGRDHPPVADDAPRLAALRTGDVAGIVGANVLGTLLTISVFGGAMADAGRGSVVLIGSQYSVVAPRPYLYDHMGGETPFMKNPAYGASKAAVVNLARYFGAHWGPAGVRVNALSPGGVLGTQDSTFVKKFSREVPLGRMLEADELRGPLLFLVSDASSFVTGAHLVVDGGYTIW